MNRLKYWAELLQTEKILWWVDVFRLLRCNHSRTPVHEGKCYCPDCGTGVIFQWVVLQCGGCNSKRESRYWARQVVPVQPCCTGCGESRFERVFLERPQYFQLHKARLLACGEQDYMERQRLQHLRVWFEQATAVRALLPQAS